MYGRSASGISTVPSACWYCSRIATTVRPIATPLPFKVCARRGFPPSPRYRTRMRRAWKSSQFDTLEISRNCSCPGHHTSRSYVFADANPMSPAQSSTTRCTSPSRRSTSDASSTIFSCSA